MDTQKNQYNAVFILRVGDENFAAAKQNVAEEFKNAGVTVLEERDMGERTLAYEIKKAERGHYLRYNIETEPQTIQPIEKNLKLRPEILKYVFFKKSEKESK